MATTIRIDPVTRIEGHLKIEVEVEDGRVTDARCIGTLFRGIEIILRGRDPRDAIFISQRVCGVCPIAHATASVLALDEAFGVAPPENGRILRNLVLGANFLQSHILHFYHLAGLDYARGPDTPPFVPRYEGDYRLSPEENQRVVDHYLQALEMRMKAQQMLAVFGGKMPHIATFLPGGVTEKPDVDEIASFHALLQELQEFIETAYLPDVLAVGRAYADYFSLGVGCRNLLSYGGFPLGADGSGGTFFPGGVYLDGELTAFDPAEILEYVYYSWYSPGTTGLHPSEGVTVPEPTGILKPEAYSWLKAPRYRDRVVEVGPLARTAVAYLAGVPRVKELVDSTLGELGLEFSALFSVMGRHLARALECKRIAEAMEEWLWQLELGGPSYTDAEVPEAGVGAGLAEAPRGSVGHWIRIEEGKIANYQIVTPTNWNASPRDDRGNPGPIEQALLGTPIADPERPIEIVRVVRSFDPCLACAVHLLAPGEEIGPFRIL